MMPAPRSLVTLLYYPTHCCPIPRPPRHLTIYCYIDHRCTLYLFDYQITPEQFQKAFGAPMEQAESLIAAKSLSISKLMVLAPPGTLDPMPHLYDTSMYTYAGLMTTAVVAHAMVRPMPRTPSPAAATIDIAPTSPAVIKDTVVGDRQVNK